jgi:hypothetical protein
MISRNSWELREWRWLVLLVLAAAAGCSGRQSTEARIQKALDGAGVKSSRLYPLAGTVTIDGLPPASKAWKSLVAVLYDPQKPDETPAFALVRDDGHFHFTEDGVEPGHYVLAFAVLKRNRRTFIGPDRLNNLYNDPDVNAKTHPEFVIDHDKPGKTDYEFNLEVAGKDPVKSPGPHAVTQASRA